MGGRCFHGLSSNPSSSVSRSLSQTDPKTRRRIVVLGAAKVGKTAIIRQFLLDQFPKMHKRTIEDLYVAEVRSPRGVSLTFQILETASSYECPAMRALSISNGDAFLLVYSVDDAESWEQIEDLRNQIVGPRGRDVPIVIVANKSEEHDTERIVERDAVEKKMKFWGNDHIECSAKENINIIHIFQQILAELNVQFDLKEAIHQHPNQNRANVYSCTEFHLIDLVKKFREVRTYGPFELNK